MTEEKQKGISRRNFLLNTGTFALGAIATGSVLEVVNPGVAEGSAPSLPWPYETLDIEVVRKRAFDNYFIGGCMYATGKALLDTLVEKVGAPWDTIPADMFKFGKGGALGWGTLCGALNGALAVIDLAAGSNGDILGHELLGWYSEFPFPSTLLDAYSEFPNQITTVSKSPLCHQSVSIWSYTSGARVNSPEKYNRCAKLAGDTAARAAELLNQWKAGTFNPVYQPSPEFERCFTCHVGSTSKYDNVQGQMDCITCHDDKTTHHL